MKVGDFTKVLLHGEKPWVEVIEMHDDEFTGRIDNHLISPLHLYSYNDVLRFKWHEDNWHPVEGRA